MKQTPQPPPGQPPAPPTRWPMQKERIVKDDGRYLVYYRFAPARADEATVQPSPSHGATPQQESA